MNFISKNGVLIIFVALLVQIALMLLQADTLSSIWFILLVLLVFLYRKPKRETFRSNAMISSLVDGTIVGIDRLQDTICIRIENNIVDASIIKAPLECKIEKVQKRNGIYLQDLSLLADKLNEKYEIWLDKAQIKIDIMPSFLSFTGVSFYPKKDDEIGFGEEIGFMMNGVIAIYLQNNATLKVSIGDKVKANESIIASLNQN